MPILYKFEYFKIVGDVSGSLEVGLDRVAAVILGGGRGARFGGNRPKQFADVADKPVIAHTIAVFEKMPEIEAIVIVVPADWVDFTRTRLVPAGTVRHWDIVPGGASRQMSSMAGLNHVARIRGIKKVVIHDAARPLVSSELIRKTIKAVDETRSAVAAMPVSDTLMDTDEHGLLSSVVDRRGLFALQTPQAFMLDQVLKAHRQALADGLIDATDDIQLVLRMGMKATIVTSSIDNLKITTPGDLDLVEGTFLIRN